MVVCLFMRGIGAMMFDFNDDLCFAEGIEALVADDLVERGYEVKFAGNMKDQFAGKDLITVTPDGRGVTFEVKADRRAKHTGNYFLEYMSNCDTGRESGPMHCQADYYAIYLVDMALVYVPVKTMRKHLKRWSKTYRHAYTGWNRGKNGGKYRGRGILLPIDELKKVAAKYIEFEEFVVC